MEFIKRNYEKIILGLVLLGLVGVVACMPVVIILDQQQMTDLRNKVIPRRPVPLPDLDLSRQVAGEQRLESPDSLDLSTTNRLFNPVLWQKSHDGRLTKVVKGNEVGPGAAVVAKITPLYFIITLTAVDTNGIAPHYSMTIEDQSAAVQTQRRKRYHSVSKGESVVDRTVTGKNEGFRLVGVKGPPENPDEMVLLLADTGETGTLSRSQPFRRADGYVADVKYDLDKPPYNGTGLRVGDHLGFGGDDYKIIAMDKNSVILSAQSNQKNYTLRYTP
jgi:hypothetical protein